MHGGGHRQRRRARSDGALDAEGIQGARTYPGQVAGHDERWATSFTEVRDARALCALEDAQGCCLQGLVEAGQALVERRSFTLQESHH